MTDYEKVALYRCLQSNTNNMYNTYMSGNPYVIGQQTLNQSNVMANYEILPNPNVDIDELKRQLANARISASQQTQEERMREILNHCAFGEPAKSVTVFSKDERKLLDEKVPRDLVSDTIFSFLISLLALVLFVLALWGLL